MDSLNGEFPSRASCVMQPEQSASTPFIDENYLPSKTEMAYIYCKATPTGSHSTLMPTEAPNCTAYGGKTNELTGFAVGFYHTSTENAGAGVFIQSFFNGLQDTTYQYDPRYVRCIRRYQGSSIPDLRVNQYNYLSIASPATSTACMNIQVTNAGDSTAYYLTMNSEIGTSYITAGCTDTCSNNNLNSGQSCIIGVKATATQNQYLYRAFLISYLEQPSWMDATVATRRIEISGQATGYGSGDPCMSSPAIGTTCSNGAIYAGVFQSGNYMITPGRCSGVENPTCTGANDNLLKTFRGSSVSSVEIAEVESVGAVTTASTVRGNINTPIIAAHPNIGSNSAADFCNDLIYGNFNDWYLPSKSELAYIYCKSTPAGTHNPLYPNESPDCVGFGGKQSILTNFNGTYLSSTEGTSTNIATQSFATGAQSVTGGRSSNFTIRCVRRY